MNLAQLFEQQKGDASYGDLALRGKGVDSIGAKRLQQLATKPLKNFPDPPSIQTISRALRVSERVVVLAAAESLALDVTERGLALARRLPANVDELGEEQSAAVLSVVRAMLAAQRLAPRLRSAERPTEQPQAKKRVARPRGDKGGKEGDDAGPLA